MKTVGSVQEAGVRAVKSLIDQGVPGLHFYVLNKSEAAAAVLNALRLP